MSGSKNNIRILDKSTYPRKTLETFEMVAAYYVDLFYNHLYFEAKKLRNDKVVSSITEGYKHALTSFLQGIEDPKLYKKSLLAMHTFFVENGFASLTFTQCTERVIAEFIPEDYYDSVLNSKKNSILRNVLNGVNKSFILKLVNNYFGMIIDQHNEPDNTRILQDEFIDLLLIEKDSMYKRFVVGKAGASGGSSKKYEIMESMQKEIKLLCTEKYESRKLISKLKKIIVNKEKQIQHSLEKMEQLKSEINELKSELAAAAPYSAPDIEPFVARAEPEPFVARAEPKLSAPVPDPDISAKHKEALNDEVLIDSDTEPEIIEVSEQADNQIDDEKKNDGMDESPTQIESGKSVFVNFDENDDIWS